MFLVTPEFSAGRVSDACRLGEEIVAGASSEFVTIRAAEEAVIS